MSRPELLRLVDIALGRLPRTACSASAGGGPVGIDTILTAVNAALSDCPFVPHPLVDEDVVPAASRVAVTTMQSMSILDFGFIGAAAEVAFDRGAGGAAATLPCTGGGSKQLSCTENGGSSTRSTVYMNCSELDAATGQIVTRNGTLGQMTGSICANPIIPANATLHFTGFTEQVAGATGHMTTLTIPNLTMVRDLGGKRVTADGTQTFDSDMSGVREHYTQTFQGFVATHTQQGTRLLVTQDGVMTVDCLGDLEFTTNHAVKLDFDTSNECPKAGELAVRRPLPGQGGAAASSEESAPDSSGGQAAANPPTGFRQFVLRSSNGTSYQVLQNSGSDILLGADSFRVTTLVGSLGGSVGSCDNAAGNGFNPEAVAAAAQGQAIAPASVFKSARITDASLPCFNQNANNGDGAVCIGPACTPDCQCAGANCSAFTLTAGTKLPTPTADVPAATLVSLLPPLDDPCSGFAGRSTYRFGASATTETLQCNLAPTDGFSLPSTQSTFAGGTVGTTMVFAYDTPLISLFNAGSAGFPIDTDGLNQTSCPPAPSNRVLNLGHSTLGSVPAPQIAFTANRGVAFDFNGDRVVDKAVSTCQIPALAKCVAPQTPTPTQGPAGSCPQTTLPQTLPQSPSGTTTNRPNALGGATCGDGGNRSPDTSFDFIAPQFGYYTFSTSASFDTLLYLRKDTCAGAEVACNDDAGANTITSAVTVQLFQNAHVVIVVDGYGGAKGDFTLTISRSDNPLPTPTANASPGPFAGLPDLQVVNVTAPSSATLNSQVQVAATVANSGVAEAGAFQVSFVFAPAQDLNQVVATAAFSCSLARLGTNENDNTAVCGPVSIGVPFVPPGNYFVGAIVDASGKVTESNEANNVGWSASPVAISAIGVEFQHETHRAKDGTVYEVLHGVPLQSLTGAQSFAITTLAPSLGSITACESQQSFSAVVGASPFLGQSLYSGTILYTRRFDSISQVEFLDTNGGLLKLDSGTGAFNVCRVAADCPGGMGESLRALDNFTVGDLCIASNVGAACVGALVNAISFGPPGGGISPPFFPGCSFTPPTFGACGGLGTLSLTATQAFVVIYTPAPASQFTLGVAGFGCSGGVTSAFKNVQVVPPLPTGCCVKGNSCTQATQLQCSGTGGTFFSNAVCAPSVGFCVA